MTKKKKYKKDKNSPQQIEKAKMLLEMTGCVDILDGRDIEKSIRGYSTSLKRKNQQRRTMVDSVNDFLNKGGVVKKLPYIKPE